MTYAFVKGHGTENDFVLLPDLDGSVHGALTDSEMADRVRRLCDRRAGLGADGILRVIRTADYDGPDRPVSDAEWFMDYRNADGTLAEMCGNGTRVFAEYLRSAGLAGDEITFATRAGDKTLRASGDIWTADLGSPKLLGATQVSVAHHFWPAANVDMGNPHAAAEVESIDPEGPVGDLYDTPVFDEDVYPRGVNVEFFARVAERHVAMRVFERGSGETRSCGTGACAVMVAAAEADGLAGERDADVTYRVDVPGGTLQVTWTTDDRILLAGTALLVAEGTTTL
ncbi:diaminopimelate epimerase [Nocardioides albertanoniae]|uniref:Diaminopimelate epimerase n=1 Tax=Nocardioides albertanoniae TaxID=1175486 RepID=A0A543ACL6_9ACTN|nr:diaminopimelate epimerase [Nocardioides albertanoniae]TQL70323.1 diaminopimelate epimerase [Nocardioides albertanoniae]